MKVDELIIDGFKSYATRTVISGWDASFNAITGLNGSGKSNILDAICFVLGISSMQTVRASNLQDLIYKRGQAGVTKASVTIVFNNSEISKSPIGFENCSTISVTRQIILGGTSKYLINGHKAQQQTVLSLFQSVQLNINNPNFLIMQGKITKVLNMRANEILSLIEEAAGTRTFEEKKAKAKKIMSKKDTKLLEIKTLLIEEIEPKFEKFRNDKRVFFEFQQTQIDLEKQQRLLVALEFSNLSSLLTNSSDSTNKYENKLAELQLDIDKVTHEIESLNEDLAQVKAARERNMNKDGELNALEQNESRLANELARLTTQRTLAKEELDSLLSKKQSLFIKKKELENLTNETKLSYDEHQKRLEEAKSNLARCKEIYEKKEELLAGLSTGLSAKGNVATGYSAELAELKNKLHSSKNLINQHKFKIEHLQRENQADEPKLFEAKKEYEHFVSKIKTIKEEITFREEKLQQSMGDFVGDTNPNELRDREERLHYEQDRLYNQLNHMKNNLRGLEFNYERPSQDFDDRLVRGVVAQLFELPEDSHDKAIALQQCAGGRLYNVVVDTSEVASQLLERGRLRKRVTMIPLDKINPAVIGSATIGHAEQIAPGKVQLALSLVNYHRDLHKAMQYVFGTTFICDDPNTAKAVTFHPQVRARSITIEGDTYEPEGNISGGSRRNNSALLLAVKDYNKLSQKLKVVDKEVSAVRDQLTQWEKTQHATSGLRNEIQMKKHELALLERKLETNKSVSLIRAVETRQQEISALEAEIEEHKKISAQLQQEITSTEKDLNEFNNDKSSKLESLKIEVGKLKKEYESKKELLANETENFQVLQWESEQRCSELEEIAQELHTMESALGQSETKESEDQDKQENLERDLAMVRAKIEDEKNSLAGLDEEFNELTRIIASKTKRVENHKIKIKSVQFELEKARNATSSLKERLDLIMGEFEWVMDARSVEKTIEQHPGVNYDEVKSQVAKLDEKFQSMRRKVNVNIMSMIEENEKREASLKSKVKIIEKDKKKIETTIAKLNGEIRKALNATYQKVSEDFGQIFADLLPGSFAKLVPVDMMDVTKGLEVKVKLGSVWKESLVELSGGQRSLIALSLIMALLQFNPAPMYILDEVDAALDLSHTQNIGHLIKTRFKGSQFIVVSLKEGMFTNANRIFRTRFQDGTSVVSVM
ncbi:Structural maintenance of chromosomes protein 2 [Lodderomyces elongisporus]|uniref:Structural maintenance of chromosomes protein 2 n=1 Tax=Lodderomyces elongisporus TaxID=36914 RepID=UPI002923D7CC|nr:Structural maintenance of chromosomes protein 2 [Lodderomyces elongisporus]WLF79614.1 Structural maintenance of chromosomes protein 2 [Lodderomyces elongisporus]